MSLMPVQSPKFARTPGPSWARNLLCVCVPASNCHANKTQPKLCAPHFARPKHRSASWPLWILVVLLLVRSEEDRAVQFGATSRGGCTKGANSGARKCVCARLRPSCSEINSPSAAHSRVKSCERACIVAPQWRRLDRHHHKQRRRWLCARARPPARLAG